jgi:hypothetical protein
MLLNRRRDFKELTALRFADQQTYYRATDVVAANNIPVEPIGNFTLVIRKADRGWLDALKYEEQQILDPDSMRPPRAL